MTDDELKDLKESVDKIHAALPPLFAFRDNFELWAKETGVFDHLVQDVLSRVPKSVVQEPCTTPATVPSVPNSGTIPGLSGTQIAEIQKAFAASSRQSLATTFAAINLDLSKGFYDYANPEKIEAAKEVYYDSPSTNPALYAYLNIIDQRDAGNQPLPKGDSRWKYVGDSVPVSSVPLSDIQAALAAYDIHVAPGKLSIGMPVDETADAQFQIGGGGSAEILFRSNMKGLDGQNPGEVHTNIISGASNDGGMRLIQYGNWGVGGLKRNTTNRPMTIFAIDSMGDVCVSDSRKPYGQVFYLVKDADGNVELCTYQVGARLEIRESQSVYGDVMRVKL